MKVHICRMQKETNIPVPPIRRNKRYEIDDLEPNESRFFPMTDVSLMSMRRALMTSARRKWGPGSYTTRIRDERISKTDDGLDIPRLGIRIWRLS